MDDAYRALCVATRRPMRNWWRRVGSWWIAALVVLLGSMIWTVWCEYHFHRQFGQAGYPSISTYPFILEKLYLLTVSLATLLWLLAAMKADFLVTQLAESTAAVAAGRLRVLRFNLALAQGAAPLAALALGVSLVTLCRDYAAYDCIPSFMQSWAVLAQLGLVGLVAVQMLWVLMFVVFSQVKRWFAVAWCVIMLGLDWLYPLAFVIYYAQRPFGFDLYDALIQHSAASFLLLLLVVPALAVLYLIPALLARGRYKPAMWLSSICLVAMIPKFMTTALGDTDYAKYGALTDLLPAALMPFLFSVEGPLHAPGQRDCLVQLYVCLSSSSEFLIPPAFAFLTLIVPVAIFAAHYYALRWIMLNIKPAVPKQKQQGPA